MSPRIKQVKRNVTKRIQSPAKRRGAAKKKAALPESAAFLLSADAAVRDTFARTVDLPTFRATADSLTAVQRLRIVDQALVLIEENYVHLPLKEAMHAVRPIQRLRLLRDRVRRDVGGNGMTDVAFHAEMLQVFTSVRDLHTNYLLPLPYADMTAFVPFHIEHYFDGGPRRYIVSHVFDGFDRPPFASGVEITAWNGVPIDRAVELNANRFAGSNHAARHARGVESMTIRPLISALPPDEDWVILDFQNDGGPHQMRIDWLVFEPDDPGVGLGAHETPTFVDTAMGIDIVQHKAWCAKRALFASKAVAADQNLEKGGQPERLTSGDIPTGMPSVFTARAVNTPSGNFGHVRIRTFSVDSADDFVGEFVKLVQQLPEEGLIVDVRGNGGGLILAGEQLLQTMTPIEIEPEPVQFINTTLNLAICRRNSPSPDFADFDLSPWLRSMELAIRTGATFSGGFPISDAEVANSIGQVYLGPVVLITDALCYSTTDIFAAGFKDHDIGIILGVDDNTGAGGANVWTHGLLSLIAGDGPDSPYEELPNGTNMRVAIRRTLRVGENPGTPLEDLGVEPDERHFMTKRDLIDGNVDLLNAAGELLANMPRRRLKAEVLSSSGTDLSLKVSTLGLDRLDILLNERPFGSVDVSDGETQLDLSDAASGEIQLYGFENGALVASRRVER